MPLLLAPAFHARQDVPAGAGGARSPRSWSRTARPTAAVRALASRLAESDSGFDAVVLAAAGSRDPAHAATVSRVAPPSRSGSASASSRRTRRPAHAAEAVAALGQPVHRVAVAALFLAPGVLHDRVVNEASQLGLRPSRSLWGPILRSSSCGRARDAAR